MLGIQYFNVEYKLIFLKNSHETANEMYSYVIKSLENLNLSVDNNNWNFRKNNSLYTNLQKDIPNSIKDYCHYTQYYKIINDLYFI